MFRTEIVGLVERAVARLVVEQAELITLGVNEQTLSQHIANYMGASTPAGLRVDVEYNRHGLEKKVLMLAPGHAPGSQLVPTVVRPDIVVHVRGTDEQNVAAFEVKKPGVDLSRDRAKLEALISQYGYVCAAHIIVGVDKGKLIGEVIWIKA